MKIVAILMQDGTSYTVGVIPPDLEPLVGEDFDGRVEKINFHRDGAFYNRGFQTASTGYSVVIVGTFIERLIPMCEVKEIHVDNSPKEKEEKVIPELADA